MGPEINDLKEIIILNRTLTWTEWGIKLVADPKHAEKLIEFFLLDATSTTTVSIGVKCAGRCNGDVDSKLVIGDEEVTAEYLSSREQSVYRGLAATLNYLAQDRYDIQFGAKELCREMANPTTDSMAKIKRASRYLLGLPVMVIEYVDQ